MRAVLAVGNDATNKLLVFALAHAGIMTVTAVDGADLVTKVLASQFDVVVAHAELPVASGVELALGSRTLTRRPALLLITSSFDAAVVVRALHAGADEVVSGPVNAARVVAHVRALGRRRYLLNDAVLRFGNVELDITRGRVFQGGRLVLLGAKEYACLVELVEAGGEFVHHLTLALRVWGDDIDPHTNSVRMAIGGLRRKLADPVIIESRRFLGYRVQLFDGEEVSSSEIARPIDLPV